MMGVSVICVSYYSRHLLENIIRNIHENVHDEIEMIVINNSPEENLDSLTSKKIIIITPKKNLGYGGGINLGIKNAKYKNIVILNPDIEVFDFSFNFSKQKKYFIAGGYRPDKPFGFKFPSVYADTIGFLFIFLRKYTRRRMNCPAEMITKVDWISGSLIATNKETIKKLNGFDETFFLFYEEVDFCKRAHKLDIPVFITPDIVYEASSAKEKASSIDVTWLKINSEINSFKTYHSQHSFGLGLHVSFIKSVSCLIVFLLNFYPKSKRLANALKYYKVLRQI